jgi:hypothetical protein
MSHRRIPGESLAGLPGHWIHPGSIAPATPDSSRRRDSAHRVALAGVLLLPLILLLFWSVGGCTMTRDGAVDQPPDVTALNGRFRNLAFEQLSFKLEKSSPLPPPAQRAIEEFISGGARRLSEDGATPERISAAEVNLNRFITGLSGAADVGELSDISAATVTATRNRLCPLYPFC